MFACMAAFQVALGLAAPRRSHVRARGVIAAIVPGLPDLGLANAAVYRDAATLASALPPLAQRVRRRGRPPVADLGAAGRRGRARRAARGGVLARLRGARRWRSTSRVCPPRTIRSTTGRTPRRRARSRRSSSGATGSRTARSAPRIRGWLEPATAYVARHEGRPACCLTMVREGAGRGRLPRRHDPRGARARACPAPAAARAARRAGGRRDGLDPAVEPPRLPRLPAARLRRGVPVRHVGARALTRRPRRRRAC